MEKSQPRWLDVWSILALLVALEVVATRLAATQWIRSPSLSLIQYLAFIAAVTGLALGFSRFSPTLVKLLAFGYGVIGITWLLGAVLSPGVNWDLRLADMSQRLVAATTLFLQKKPVYDPVLFLLLMCVLFWVLCLSAGYYLVRYASPWMSILPSGVALLIINHYDHFSDAGLRYIGAYILLALLVLGRLAFIHKREEWQRKGVFFAPETSGDLGRATLVVVAALVVFSWTVPSMVASGGSISEFWANNIVRPWETFTARMGNAFSSLQTRVVVVNNFYGNSLSLNSGSHLSNDVMFTVSPTTSQPNGARYYWQVFALDTYADGQWSSPDFTAKNFTPVTYTINYPVYQDRQIIEFVITSRVDTQNLWTAPQPVWASIPVQALLYTGADAKQEEAGLSANPPLHVGEVYHVRASISVPTVSDLRSASLAYPAEVTNQDLQIPSDLLPEFRQLALQITAGMNTQYDKTNAITQWLRDNITYEQVIPPIPPDKDPIAWFLFDLKKGYCNYYASAEVLLLRSIGIPARMSDGYAQGTYDPIKNEYVVLASDAHAWPEVYFTGYGWVEFEPTVSQPARTLPLGGASSDTIIPTPTFQPRDKVTGTPGVSTANNHANPSGLTAAQQAQLTDQRIAISTGIVVLLILVFVYLRFARPRLQEIALPIRLEKGLRKRNWSVPGWLHLWSLRAALSPFERAYDSLAQALWLLRHPALPAQTPAERVEVLVSILPEADQHARTLLKEYQRAEYSLYPADLPRARWAGHEVRRMAFKAFLRRLVTIKDWPIFK